MQKKQKTFFLNPALSREKVKAIADATHMAGGGIEPHIGDILADGAVYGGRSPDTGSPMYVMPEDAAQAMDLFASSNYVRLLNQNKVHGHDDWRIPTKNELKVLFNYRTAIGGFNSGIYRSSTRYQDTAMDSSLRFSNGEERANGFGVQILLRCVR